MVKQGSSSTATVIKTTYNDKTSNKLNKDKNHGAKKGCTEKIEKADAADVNTIVSSFRNI